MADWNINVEYIPEPGYDGVDWHWKATVSEVQVFTNGVAFPRREYEIEAKFNLPTIEEAQENFNVLLKPYIAALNMPRNESWVES